MQQQIYEGTWEEIAQHAAELRGRRLRLTVLSEQNPFDAAASLEQPAGNGHLYFGMFKGDLDVTEEEFKLAEWRGQDIDI